MSAKTKIVVLHMKELVYTLIFVGLGILLAVLFMFMFKGNDEGESVETMGQYAPGVYSQSVVLGSRTLEVQVIVEEDRIHSVSFVNMDETVAAMYPLIEPAMENIAAQVVERQTTEGITYEAEYQYTSAILLSAIETAIEKADPGKY